jgi:hypothetical protein
MIHVSASCSPNFHVTGSHYLNADTAVFMQFLDSDAVAGLVAITPASGFVGPNSAVIIGVPAGMMCFLSSTTLKKILGYDDALDAFGVHCIGGIVGALLTGVFASTEISGPTGSVITQLWGVGTTPIYGFVMSMIILKLIGVTIGLRVKLEEEREGLDILLNGESVGQSSGEANETHHQHHQTFQVGGGALGVGGAGRLRYDRDRGERPRPPARFCSGRPPRGRSRAPHGGI